MAKWVLSQRSIDRLQGVHEDLIKILLESIKDSPLDFGIAKDGGLRTVQRQRELYAIGRRGIEGEKPVTWTMKSRHLNGEAFDIIVYRDGKVTWEERDFEIVAGHILGKAAKLMIPLTWGGSFKKPDMPHFELTRGFYEFGERVS